MFSEASNTFKSAQKKLLEKNEVSNEKITSNEKETNLSLNSKIDIVNLINQTCQNLNLNDLNDKTDSKDKRSKNINKIVKLEIINKGGTFQRDYKLTNSMKF